MAKDNKKKQVNVKEMAKIIITTKTDKEFVHQYNELLMEYKNAIEKAKEVTR